MLTNVSFAQELDTEINTTTEELQTNINPVDESLNNDISTVDNTSDNTSNVSPTATSSSVPLIKDKIEDEDVIVTSAQESNVEPKATETPIETTKPDLTNVPDGNDSIDINTTNNIMESSIMMFATPMVNTTQIDGVSLTINNVSPIEQYTYDTFAGKILINGNSNLDSELLGSYISITVDNKFMSKLNAVANFISSTELIDNGDGTSTLKAFLSKRGS